MADNIEAVKDANKKVEIMAESKLLDFNLDKSCMVLFGSRKFKKNVRKSIDNDPIMFCNHPMKISASEKYLGDYLGSSLSESVLQTIQRRKGLVLKLISEIKVTVEDCRSSIVGGIKAGFDIWTMAVEPFLFNNCETWTEMPKKAENILNSLYSSFFSAIFCIPRTCPKPASYWDSGFLMAGNFIIQRKVMFLHHLISLPEESLAKEVYTIQKENSYPGLVKESEQYLIELGIDSDPGSFSKWQFKKLVKSKIHEKNKADLLNQIKSYKKLNYETMVHEDYGMKTYLSRMNLRDARTCFAARAQMLSTVQMNYKHNPEYIMNDHKCVCGEDDHQSHLTSCPSYSHLRDGLNLAESDSDLVLYYQRVIRERETARDREGGGS